MEKIGSNQNGSVSYSGEKIIDSNCPRCLENKIPAGLYALLEINVPLKIRILFFNINLETIVKIQYCPKCGFLRVTVNKS